MLRTPEKQNRFISLWQFGNENGCYGITLPVLLCWHTYFEVYWWPSNSIRLFCNLQHSYHPLSDYRAGESSTSISIRSSITSAQNATNQPTLWYMSDVTHDGVVIPKSQSSTINSDNRRVAIRQRVVVATTTNPHPLLFPNHIQCSDMQSGPSWCCREHSLQETRDK